MFFFIIYWTILPNWSSSTKGNVGTLMCGKKWNVRDKYQSSKMYIIILPQFLCDAQSRIIYYECSKLPGNDNHQCRIHDGCRGWINPVWTICVIHVMIDTDPRKKLYKRVDGDKQTHRSLAKISCMELLYVIKNNVQIWMKRWRSKRNDSSEQETTNQMKAGDTLSTSMGKLSEWAKWCSGGVWPATCNMNKTRLEVD